MDIENERLSTVFPSLDINVAISPRKTMGSPIHFIGFLFLCVLLNCVNGDTFNHVLSTTAKKDQKIAEYFFNIEAQETMVYYDEAKDRAGTPVVFDKDGKMLLRNPETCVGTSRELNETERQSVVVGDGGYRRVLSINSGIPGPTIVVYQGTQIVVHVKNAMLTESVVMHWHGMLQYRTPWMDGVTHVTQCPIGPSESFTYRFIASTTGTHWYHSHSAAQRADGLYGALIVLDRKETYPWESASYDKEFIMLPKDYSRKESSNEMEEMVLADMMRFKNHDNYGDLTTGCHMPNLQHDGMLTNMVPHLSSVLVNGKGHYYPDRITPENPKMPLEVYTVNNGGRYKFRIINAAMEYTFRISIDEHDLVVTSSDGHEFSDVTVQYLVIGPGERYDFYINAAKTGGNYWIRTETMDVVSFFTKTPVEPMKHFSILRYDGSNPTNPASTKRSCSTTNKCSVFNCPFEKYGPHSQFECIGLTSRTRDGDFSLTNLTKTKKTEVFLNFHFSRNDKTRRIRSSINGRRFRTPPEPLLSNPSRDLKYACDDAQCERDGHCNCTHKIQVSDNDTVQMVFYNWVNFPPGGRPHTVHLHGFYFYVLKMAYGVSDENGTFIGNNPDLKCLNKGTETCINATWSTGHPTGLNTVNPVKKDTVFVPPGGYVVVRFKADNPGWWLLHCHIQIHMDDGMALLFYVGQSDVIPKPPKGFKTCGEFTWPASEFERILAGDNSRPDPNYEATTPSSESNKDEKQGDRKCTPESDAIKPKNEVDHLRMCSGYVSNEVFYSVVVVLAVLLVLAIGVSVYLVTRSPPRGDRKTTSKENLAYE